GFWIHLSLPGLHTAGLHLGSFSTRHKHEPSFSSSSLGERSLPGVCNPGSNVDEHPRWGSQYGESISWHFRDNRKWLGTPPSASWQPLQSWTSRLAARS